MNRLPAPLASSSEIPITAAKAAIRFEQVRFGYDAATGQVSVVYDAALSTAGGGRVETRRFVASAPGFAGQPVVINGASELLGQVFGDAGRHARSAVGVAALPLGAPVEVEVVAALG